MLPDYSWYRIGWSCKDLSPDFDKGEIYCKDDELPDWLSRAHRWSLDGKSLVDSEWVPDMEKVPGRIILGDFVPYAPEEE